MIKVTTRKYPVPEDGKDTHVHVEINCETAQQAVYEYAHITANLRDMIIANSPNPVGDDEVQRIIMNACKDGLTNVPHSEKAAANLRK